MNQLIFGLLSMQLEKGSCGILHHTFHQFASIERDANINIQALENNESGYNICIYIF
jgi:hypothetical protein